MMVKKDSIIVDADPRDAEDRAVTAEGLEQGLVARRIRMARTALGLSQTAFARRFRVPVGTLRDWEQARVTPPSYALAYIKLIAAHPDLVAREVA